MFFSQISAVKMIKKNLQESAFTMHDCLKVTPVPVTTVTKKGYL
jgi:hypothetical protein